jgi:Skp family chaperone for outer membrane proteins
MSLKFTLLAALVAGTLPVVAFAQTPAAAPAEGAAATAPKVAPVEPSAYPAKIALVAFEEAVYATNEGQHAVDDVRKKFEPQKQKIDALAAEIDSMKKQLQAAPATLTDAERSSRLKAIDAKDKEYQRDADDAQTAYNAELQDSLGKVAQKVHTVMISYVEKNGYTLLLNVGGQQTPVMWTSASPNADITEAIVTAYNASSGVSAPPPPAPSPTGATRPKPTTTPHTTTKPPSQ